MALAPLPSPRPTATVFPPPPPTTNTLTPERRAQLRKSTKKLGQILGATPQLLDADVVSVLGPVHIQIPPRSETPGYASRSPAHHHSYFPRDSPSSEHSVFYPTHPYAISTPLERESSISSLSESNSHRLLGSISGPSRNLTSPSSANFQSPPFRLAAATTTSPDLTTFPSTTTPPSPSSNYSATFSLIKTHSRSNSLDEFVSTTAVNNNNNNNSNNNSPNRMWFNLRPVRHSATTTQSNDSASDKSLPSTARRQKLSRLRRMLGEDVPVDLVFPGKDEVEVVTPVKVEEEEDQKVAWVDEPSSSPPSTPNPLPVAGTAIPRPRKISAGKIVGARDSMGALTPHRAKRQDKLKSEKVFRPLPNPPGSIAFPTTTSTSPNPSEPSSPQKQLCIIVESPEEHGSSLFEGFGFGGTVAKKSTVVMESQWQVTSEPVSGLEDTTNKLWSTRKGYGGWDRPGVSDDDAERERKKSMSYRKPPPPVDF